MYSIPVTALLKSERVNSGPRLALGDCKVVGGDQPLMTGSCSAPGRSGWVPQGRLLQLGSGITDGLRL